LILTKKKLPAKAARDLPPLEAHEITAFRRPTNRLLEKVKWSEFDRLTKYPRGCDDETRLAIQTRARDFYVSLKPTDGLEGMLAMHMVATHNAVLDCLAHAALEGQSFEVVEMYNKNAQKLMTLYMSQVAALDKHRGRGQQTITVEHVNVADGGQATIANIGPGALQQGRNLPQIEDRHEVPLDLKAEASMPNGRKKR
jgi:hypothetical protein